MGRAPRRGVLAMVVAGLIAVTTVGSAHAAPPTTAAAAAVTTSQVTVSPTPADVTPFVRDGAVWAVAVVGNKVVLGGTFTSIRNRADGSPPISQKYLMVFNRTTGLIDTTFRPVLDEQVFDLAPAADGHSVYVAGRFKRVNGVWAGGVAKFDLNTNTRTTAWNPNTDGSVYTLAVNGSSVYLGGTFSHVNANVTRTRLAAVDATTGAVQTKLNLPVTNTAGGTGTTAMVWKLDVNPAGTRMVLVGNFTTVNGQIRRQVAMINLGTTSTLSTWATDRYNHGLCSDTYDSHPRDIDISPDGTYFVIGTTGAWAGTQSLCDAAARWELGATGPNQSPTWVDYTGGDTITSVEITPTTIYLGGHFRWMNNSNTPHGDAIGPGGVVRRGLAALDPQNGMPLPWNPTRDLGYGVLDMVATTDGLYIGHDTNIVAGKTEARVAYFPAAGGSTVPVHPDPALPTNLYTADGANRVVKRPFSGTTAPSAGTTVATTEKWSTAKGVFNAGWYVYTGSTDGKLRRRTFDGTRFGAPAVVSSSWWNTSTVRTFAYSKGRLYYTVPNDNHLYMRNFDPVSGLVGSQKLTALGGLSGLDWRTVTGMTFAGGKLIYTTSDGYLRTATATIALNGVPAISGAKAISGPALNGQKYTYVDIFQKPVG